MFHFLTNLFCFFREFASFCWILCHRRQDILHSLHNTVGGRALDDILPFILEALNDADQGENGFENLRQVMAIKPRVVLPYLFPHPIAPPVNTKAFSILAGNALTCHFNCLLSTLLTSVTATIRTLEKARLLTDNDPGVLNPALDALNAVIKTFDKTQQMAHVDDLRYAVRFAMIDSKGQEFLPGCCLSKEATRRLCFPSTKR